MQSVFRMLNPVDRFYQIDVIHPKNSNIFPTIRFNSFVFISLNSSYQICDNDQIYFIRNIFITFILKKNL